MRFVMPVPVVVFAMLVACAAVPGLAQQSEQVFEEETAVTFVEIPVRVTRDGDPVRGLTAEDFVIYDQGERRSIQVFEVLDVRELDGSRVPDDGVSSAASAAARRHFLLFFDLDFTHGPYLGRAQKAALELVRRGLRPTDVVGVALFHGRGGGSSVIGFTSDRGEVVEALEELGRLLAGGETGLSDASPGHEGDALGLTFGGWDVAAAEIGRAAIAERSLADEALGWYPGGGGGGNVPDGVGETLADMARFAEEDMRQSRAAKASTLIESLRLMARQTRFLDGAKHLVLFSQGFESSLYTQDGQSWLHTEIQDAMEEFRRSGWTLHGIEAAEVSSRTTQRLKRESLSLLAHETGGDLYSRSADLSGALGELLERTSVTYLLGFQTGEIPVDGSFREVRVELAEGSEGARVLHRSGYYAPRPGVAGDSETWGAEAGELLLAGSERDEIGTAVVAAPLRMTPEGARVPVLVEIAGAGLGSPKTGAVRTDLYVYAFTRTGEVEAARSRRFVLDPAGLPSLEGGFKLLEVIELPPGEHQIRVLVRNVETGAVALRVASLIVPDGGGAVEGILPPIFVQAADDPWLLVNQGREDGAASGRPFPYRFRERDFLPAAAPVVEPGDGRVLFLMGYGLPQEVQGLRLRVVDLQGQAVDGVRFALEGTDPGGAGVPTVIALQVQVEDLSPGTYRVEAAWSGIAGWTPGLPFRVTEKSTS